MDRARNLGLAALGTIGGLVTRDVYYSAKNRALPERARLFTYPYMPFNYRRGLYNRSFITRYGKRYGRSRYRRGRPRRTRKFRSKRARTYYRRRRKTRQIGFPIRKLRVNRTQVFNVDLTPNSRTLFSYDLTAITRAAEASSGFRDPTKRDSNRLNLHGIRIVGNVNAADAMRWRHVFNFAIIAERVRPQVVWSSGINNFVPATHFFRDEEGISQANARDFSTTLNSLEMNRLPINTDAYVVLMRKRLYIDPRTHFYDGTGASHFDTGNSDKEFHIYLPIKRQIQYYEPTVDDNRAATGRLAFVFWHDKVANTAAEAGVGTSLVNIQFIATTFWTNVRDS